LDDHLAAEVRGQVQGAGAGGRSEEWHDPEALGEDQYEFETAPAVDGRADAESPVELGSQERAARSELGRFLPRSVFPATGSRLVEAARREHAADAVVAELRRLDPNREYANVADIWAALGYPLDHRF
jgi:hypothetical protein